MKNVLPALAIALAAGVTVYAMTKEPAQSEDAHQVKLPVAAVSAPEITPWLQAAATELGHTKVRAYDGSVFIDVGDDRISFFKEGNSLNMHVAFESKYRHAKADRDPALKELQAKGETIYQQAMQMQARAASKERFASATASTATGG